MKLKKTNTNVTEYTVSYYDGNDYIITITETEEVFPEDGTETVYSAWIRGKNQCIQLHMLGVLKKDATRKRFIEIITNRLEYEIESYKDAVRTIESAANASVNSFEDTVKFIESAINALVNAID